MADIKFEYHSVKDVLPKDDGIFYDVMVILYGTSIEGGYNYYRELIKMVFSLLMVECMTKKKILFVLN